MSENIICIIITAKSSIVFKYLLHVFCLVNVEFILIIHYAQMFSYYVPCLAGGGGGGINNSV